ncbi:MAG TPA: glycosyltransferase [Ignavibacteria bacterium]
MKEKKEILCISQSLWEGPKRVRHNIMREFVKRGNRVIFVEAYLTWVKLIKNIKYWKIFLNIFKRPLLNNEGIFVVTAPPLLPFIEWNKTINTINWLIISFWLKYFVIKKLDIESPYFFTFSPLTEKLIGKFNEKISIYFCNDPFKQIFKYKSAYKNIEKLENLLTRKVNLVFCVSEKLLEERIKYNSNTFLIPLAVNNDLFSKAYNENTIIPDDIKNLPKPIIGHIGVLNNRIDIDLIKRLSDNFVDYSFVFIGPITEIDNNYKSKLNILKSKKNIYFLGDKNEDDLPSYLKAIDVCIIPYVKDDVTKYIKANSKFFQYVSAGKPVVSTIGPKDLDENLCFSVNSYEDFIKSIEKAILTNTKTAIDKRKDFIKYHTWSNRVDEIEKIIEEYLKNK